MTVLPYGERLLDALDVVVKAHREIIDWSIQERSDDLIECGEETLPAWRLELHGRVWRIVAPDDIFLGWRELAFLGDVAVRYGMTVRVQPSLPGGVHLERRAAN